MIQRLFFTLLMFVFVGCSANKETYFKTSNDTAITSDSIVTIIRPQVLSNEDGIPVSVGYIEHCNAFSVRDYDNKSYLVTAAHCVDEIGSDVVFEAPSGFGYGHAKVIERDPAYDWAIATTDHRLQPLVLDATYEPLPGDAALTASSLKRASTVGTVVEELSYGWVQTTNDMTYGWSGSPVTNAEGHVWGIVSKCRLTEDLSDCEKNYAIIARIYK